MRNVNRFDLHNGKPPEDYVIADRSGKWGNPFSVEKYGRKAAIARYRVYLYQRIQEAINHGGDNVFLCEIQNPAILEGRVACWCAPNMECHTDVLIDMAKWVHENHPR